MVVSCEEVWREISNYLEGDVEPGLRASLEEHLRGCKHCTAVMDGTRNVVELYADERMIELPAGFDQRLRLRLEANMPRSRGTSFGWMVAAAAALLVVGSFEAASSSGFTGTKSALAQSGKRVPPNMLVVVSEESRLFHAPGCKFIHDKAHQRTLMAGEAIHEGYAPCARCMKQYLSDVAGMRPLTPDVMFAAGSAQAAVQ